MFCISVNYKLTRSGSDFVTEIALKKMKYLVNFDYKEYLMTYLQDFPLYCIKIEETFIIRPTYIFKVYVLCFAHQ